MPVSMRDKIDIYENFLTRIANIDVEKECVEALENPKNPGNVKGELYLNKYPFAFGMVSQAFKSAVSDAQYALNQAKK